MRVVLFGGGGFIGQHLAAALSARAHHVVVVTRDRETVKNNLILLPNTDVIACDYNQAQTIPPLFAGADAVVNLIGILNERTNGDFERVHCEITRILASTAQHRKIRRFVQFSALGASSLAPSAYLRSKDKAEQVLKDNSTGMRTVVIRPSVIFGRGDSFVTLFANLVRRLPFLLLPCANSLMQPIAVEDVSRIIVDVLENGDSDGKTLLLGGPDEMNLAEIVTKIAYACEHPKRIIGLGKGMSYAAGTVADFLPFSLPFSRDNCLSASVNNTCTDAKNDTVRLLDYPTSLDAGLAKMFERRDRRGSRFGGMSAGS